MNFPKTVYIHQDAADEDLLFLLLADAEIEGIPDGTKVAIYELREVKIKRGQRALEDK
jgi:hypothetical protein